MKTGLYLFDFDNTIFDHANNRIPQKVKEALLQIKERYRVVIATGRPYFLIKDYLEQLDIQDCICFNGNLVIANDEVIYKEVFDQSVVSDLIDFAHDSDTSVLLEGHEEMFATKADDAYMTEYLRKLNLVYPKVQEDYHLYHDVYQLGVFIDEAYEKELFEKFGHLHFVRHNKFGMDVVMTDELKEKGLKYLIDYYQVKHENTYAFGDGTNDIGLFKAVATSVAMENSPDELKEVATFVTGHVSENGLYDAIERLGLLND